MRTLLSKNMIKGCVIKTETPATFGLIFWASEYLYSRERQREKRARAPLRTRRNARAGTLADRREAGAQQ